jgi:serine/threonine protein kinase
VYLLHDPTCEWAGRDGSYAWREATAEQIEPAPVSGRILVRLRQVRVDRHTTAAKEQVAGLRTQGALLTRLGGQAGLPRLAGQQAERDALTLITVHPPGRAWRELFGPGPEPTAPLTAAAALAAAADVAGALAVLHDSGTSHRMLHPGGLFIDGPRCRLRDAGLAAIPPAAGEGGSGADRGGMDGASAYQAPEQRHSAHATGPATDVYQLAAIVYHTLTRHPPAPAGSPPARAALPGLPADADVVILRGLDADPARRPSIRQLATAFRVGRRALSLGGGS